VGSAVAETNPACETTLTIYDGIGRVVRTIDGAGDTTTTTYDGQVSGVPGAPGTLVETAVTDGVGDTTRTEHDGAGRVLASFDALGKFTTSAYDADSNRISTRDPNSVGYDAVFDARNREISRTDTAGSTTQTAYDANSNVVQTIDARSHASSFAYDGRDRRTSSTDRIGGTASFCYDENSNLTSMTDAQGGVTSYRYDARNLEVTETLPAGEQTGACSGCTDTDILSYAYDAERRLVERTDQKLDVTTYVYDRADRQVDRCYNGAQCDTFAYDLASRMTQTTSGLYGNTVARTHDRAGRITSESLHLTTSGPTYTTSYSYDTANRVTSIAYPDGSVVSKTYTARDQIDTVKFTPAGSTPATVATFTYDDGRRRVGTSYGNGRMESRAYTPGDNTIQSIGVPGTGSLAAATGFTYDYDPNKNPLDQLNSVDTNDDQHYAYDFDDRLGDFTRTSPSSTVLDTQHWDLSLASDWNTFTSDGVSETRTHDAVHELTSRNGQAFTYDAKGNLTQDDRASAFAWDFENHMTSATVGGNAAQYTYDALWRRVSKTVGGQTTVYVYDGWRAVAEYAGGASPASPVREFVFGKGLDEELMMAACGHQYFYHDSDLGSIQALTDERGAVVETYRYDPYGKVLVESVPTATACALPNGSAVGNPFMYTGQRADGETGLYYYKNRYYSSAEGRFLSRDPIEYKRAPNGNLYEYVGSRPVMFVDPTGLITVRAEVQPPTGQCGEYTVYFSMRLDNPAPVDGYLVQEITVHQDYSLCPPRRVRSRQDYVFYESLGFIRRGQQQTGHARIHANLMPGGVADQSHQEPMPNSHGQTVVTGVIKFFPAADTGRLGDPLDVVNMLGGALGGIGNQNPLAPPLAIMGANATDPTTGFGGDNQVAESGDFPSTTLPPRWWNNAQNEPFGYRSVDFKWNCCSCVERAVGALGSGTAGLLPGLAGMAGFQSLKVTTGQIEMLPPPRQVP
jgi:RHS repeat-associated protein